MSEFNKFSRLWYDLPREERLRLLPHALESQLLHIEQVKLKAIKSHKKLIAELNDWQNNIKMDLKSYEPPK